MMASGSVWILHGLDPPPNSATWARILQEHLECYKQNAGEKNHRLQHEEWGGPYPKGPSTSL